MSYSTVICSFIWEEVWIVLLCSFLFLQQPNSCPWDHGCKHQSRTQSTMVEHPESSGEKVGQDLLVGMEGKGRITNQEGRGTAPSERAEELGSLPAGPKWTLLPPSLPGTGLCLSQSCPAASRALILSQCRTGHLRCCHPAPRIPQPALTGGFMVPLARPLPGLLPAPGSGVSRPHPLPPAPGSSSPPVEL